jgi:hypothetical protein
MTVRRREGGQATVEWLGLVLVVCLAAASIPALASGRIPAAGLARAIATRLTCAAALSDSCSVDGALVAAYGAELAARVERSAPEIVYEPGTRELPVDFRSCRARRCAEASEDGRVWASDLGEPAVAFVHVVDCRDREGRRAAARRGLDCSSGRAGNLYVQYWLYYPDSATSPWSDLPSRPGAHRDDWEGYQLRVGPSGTDARATSHHGYDHRGGPLNWPSDAGLVSRSAWGRATGRLYVSARSHAGHVYEPPRLAPVRGVRTTARAGAVIAAGALGARPPRPRSRQLAVRFTATRRAVRWTPASRLRLIPVESLDAAERRARFAVTPPWRKPVYRDPEDRGT